MPTSTLITSKLGQLWIILTSAISISAIGLVWSYLWAQPVREILPFIAVGLVVWQLISAILIESTTLLPTNIRYFHNQYTPTSTIVFALAFRHTATFFMNLIFPLFLSFGLGLRPSSSVFLAIPGVLLTLVWCLWMSLMLSILCTRYRDIIQVVTWFKSRFSSHPFFGCPSFFQRALRICCPGTRLRFLLQSFAIRYSGVTFPGLIG
jgi:ABC-type polysaccharide/polyol phosphate export permease